MGTLPVSLHIKSTLIYIVVSNIFSIHSELRSFLQKGTRARPFLFWPVKGRAFFSRRLFKWGSTFFFFTISPFKEPSAEKSSFFILKINLRSEEFFWSKFFP